MPPKRAPATPTKSKSGKAKGKNAQTSISNFFTSPSKPKTYAAEGRKRQHSVISIGDSDDERDDAATSSIHPALKKQGKGDGNRERQVSEDWAESAGMVVDRKGKGRDESLGMQDEMDRIDFTESEPPGINGSSSSSHRLSPHKPDIKPVSPDLKAISPITKPKRLQPDTSKPIASIFAKRPTTPPPQKDIKPNVQSPSTPSKKNTSTAITSISAEAVEPIDFDSDAFLFRPGSVDISKWPKGRLPYSVLVGVYVQVGSTRSRLTIVRVLTK
jgi:hypothetical protein